MQDIPDKATLLAAVRRFLKTELAGVVPDPALRFRVLIAANLLGVIERELSLGPDHHTAEVDRLESLLSEAEVEALRTLESEEARRVELASLYDRLLADESVDPDALFGHVKATLAEKLAVVNPRFDLSPTIE